MLLYFVINFVLWHFHGSLVLELLLFRWSFYYCTLLLLWNTLLSKTKQEIVLFTQNTFSRIFYRRTFSYNFLWSLFHLWHFNVFLNVLCWNWNWRKNSQVHKSDCLKVERCRCPHQLVSLSQSIIRLTSRVLKLKDDQQFLVGFGNLMKILKTMDIRFIVIKTMVLSPCVEQHLFLNNFNNIGKRYGGKFVLSRYNLFWNSLK